MVILKRQNKIVELIKTKDIKFVLSNQNLLTKSLFAKFNSITQISENNNFPFELNQEENLQVLFYLNEILDNKNYRLYKIYSKKKIGQILYFKSFSLALFASNELNLMYFMPIMETSSLKGLINNSNLTNKSCLIQRLKNELKLDNNSYNWFIQINLNYLWNHNTLLWLKKNALSNKKNISWLLKKSIDFQENKFFIKLLTTNSTLGVHDIILNYILNDFLD